MSDTKWADVAHYYAKSYIEIITLRGSNPKTGRLTGMYQSDAVTVMFGENQNVDKRKFSVVQLQWCKPILRHRDDITEAQAREICEPMIESLKEVEGDSFEPPKSYKEFLLRPFTHKGTWSLLDHALGNPRDWHKFIKWGIDVFRLIESGQAIRKEVGNG